MRSSGWPAPFALDTPARARDVPDVSVLDKVHGKYVFGRRVQVLARELADQIPQGARVLDVGCGDGTIAYLLLQARPDIQIEGIDVLVRPETKVPVKEFDGKHIPHPDKSFDVVMFVDVLHHTDDPASVLAECARVSRRGVIVKDHLREGLFSRPVLQLMDWVGNRGHGVRLPYNYLSKAEWDGIFSRLAIEPQKWTGHLGLYPFPFSAIFDRRLHFIARLVPKS